MINYDKRNYRKHSKKNKDLINKSLKECGAGRSIVIDNENNIIPGIYLQETKKNIEIYDLRFVKPNAGEYIPIAAIHTIEHLFATWLKTQSDIKNDVVSFNPGGCQTMFYLEVFNDNQINVKKEILNCIQWCMLQHTVPGATKEECGNYKSHDLRSAKLWLLQYYDCLTN